MWHDLRYYYWRHMKEYPKGNKRMNDMAHFSMGTKYIIATIVILASVATLVFCLV